MTNAVVRRTPVGCPSRVGADTAAAGWAGAADALTAWISGGARPRAGADDRRRILTIAAKRYAGRSAGAVLV